MVGSYPVPDWESVRTLTVKPLKFTITSPDMLARTLLDSHYADLKELVNAIAQVLQRQVSAIDILGVERVRWVGFTCYDLIMPLFMFIVGAATPFSFAKYQQMGYPIE